MKGKQIKKKAYSRWLSLTLILSLLISLVGCGEAKPEKTKDASKLINHVEVMIPNPTAPEAMVGLQGNIALQYYIEARMYLEKLSMLNPEEIDRTELKSMVNDTIKAFENAEKMSSFLSTAVDLWMKTDDKREAPKVEVLQKADVTEKSSSLYPFILKAYAAEYSPSEMTAQAIVDAFDKAENGHKLKTLAELLGTDARHAMEELKIAQATLEGADAMAVAEQATTCIRVAKTLKTAGTVAGLVIAAAPVATGAAATMATGEMIATTGGIITSGANTVLEMTSTGATLYYGTDENKITNAADKIADNELVKDINTFVGLAGIGYNVKNVIEKVDSLMKQPGVLDVDELLSLTTNNAKETSDLFGLVSYGIENPDKMAPSLTSLTMELTREGMKIILKDTEIGTSPEQQKGLIEILQEADFTYEDAEAAVAHAVESIKKGGKATADAALGLPMVAVNNFLELNEWISPSSEFDLDAYIAEKTMFMESLASAHSRAASEKEGQNTEKPVDEGQSAEADNSKGEIPTKAEILGAYECKFSFGGNETIDDILINDGGEGKITIVNGELVVHATYDAATASARYTIQEEHEDGIYYEHIKIVFHKQGEGVMMKMTLTEVDNEDSEAVFSISGVKR